MKNSNLYKPKEEIVDLFIAEAGFGEPPPHLREAGAMITEELNEKIAVASENRFGKIVPVSFVWRDRDYAVEEVFSIWTEKRGGSLAEQHYSVSSGGPDTYELIFNPVSRTWRLGHVMLEG